jgi:hypothetical protein
VLASESAPAGDGQGGAVPRDARDECRRLRATQGEPVEGGCLAAVATLRPAIRGDHCRRAGQQPDGGRQGTAEVAFDAALEGEAAEGRRQEGEGEDSSLAGVERAELVGDHSSLANQERRRSPGVQGDTEAVLKLSVLVLLLPAQEPGDEREVPRARHR